MKMCRTGELINCTSNAFTHSSAHRLLHDRPPVCSCSAPGQSSRSGRRPGTVFVLNNLPSPLLQPGRHHLSAYTKLKHVSVCVGAKTAIQPTQLDRATDDALPFHDLNSSLTGPHRLMHTGVAFSCWFAVERGEDSATGMRHGDTLRTGWSIPCYIRRNMYLRGPFYHRDGRRALQAVSGYHPQSECLISCTLIGHTMTISVDCLMAALSSIRQSRARSFVAQTEMRNPASDAGWLSILLQYLRSVRNLR
ncbi:hypothetical protein CC80DRAFT_273049 [Byssothecium circinans]|uniref:Uncharacterized protein n=1 Tax=Byssothecium circinans TaxID=147558 RepID=A0A6A5TAM4_9PLEO|nr:hypothetical protein CC80DRAFT_273049 [Byssothecium circinans]